MSTPNARPTRENWQQFCQEDPLTADEAAAWCEMADTVKLHRTPGRLEFIIAATREEEAAYRKARKIATNDWANLARKVDTSRRYKRAELAAWARWQEQEQAR